MYLRNQNFSPGAFVIFPSVTYGLILWGSCCNSDLYQSLERLHCRADLPKDMASFCKSYTKDNKNFLHNF